MNATKTKTKVHRISLVEITRVPQGVETAVVFENDLVALETFTKQLIETLVGVLESENDMHRDSDDRWSVFRQDARTLIATASA